MAKKKSKEERMQLIEIKYEQRIGKLIKRYGNKSMQELWVALDELKDKMKKEIEELENREHNMDTEDAVRDER